MSDTTVRTTDTRDTAPPAPPMHNVPLVFSSLLLGMLIVSLGQMIFATALPTIVADLGGVDKMSWVITAYLLTMTIGLPVYGKLGDQIGRKPLFVAAILIFLAGSVLGALAWNIDVLIAARAVQGLGGGGLMVLSQAIVADVVPARQRGRYMGIMGSVFGLSSVLGPLLGGFFTEGPGWRWALWFNLPICLLALGVAVLSLRLPNRGAGRQTDWPGTALMVIGTSSLILAASWGGNRYAWTDPMVLGLGALFLVCAVAFVLVERRSPHPLIPMTLFAERNFTLSTAAGLLIGVAMFGCMAYLPTYIQMVHGLSPTAAGMMMIPMMVGMMGTSIVVGNIVSRTGRYKWYPVVGTVIMAVGLWFIGSLRAHDTLVHLGVVIFVFGFGLGLCMQLLVLIVQNSFPVSMVGTATASNNFFRQIGGTLGSAIVGSLFVSRLADLMGEKVPAAAAAMGPEGAAAAGAITGGSGSNSMSPDVLAGLPGPLHEAIVASYNDALVPIYHFVVPLVVLATIFLLFLREDELKETVS
ncbi:MDR family MFS transporter [Rhodococcus sp. IEGM 1408]|uniref:MDR family MFS transporter n=1 Tax=Rhodococcus sp. IEGM 1408 TaxID=3082220 RepID=UPI0029542904|nr:MDR family MFS transporter [Rhodococcus sp. IEGM 1408]MDV8000500.1 MDR family MFS transporter [Rhodococcus sp. IEGM 1408]